MQAPLNQHEAVDDRVHCPPPTPRAFPPALAFGRGRLGRHRDVLSQPIAKLPRSDFTAVMLLENLPGRQDIFYSLRFRDLAQPSIEGEPAVGRFRIAPADRCDVIWGGDVAGQGFGINPDDGGMVTLSAMRNHKPDWKNVTIPDKAKVAETL